MLAKLVVLIFVFGGCCGGVLALRQSRLQAVHEIAEARLRIREHDEHLRSLRADLARVTAPAALRTKLASLGDASAWRTTADHTTRLVGLPAAEPEVINDAVAEPVVESAVGEEPKPVRSESSPQRKTPIEAPKRESKPEPVRTPASKPKPKPMESNGPFFPEAVR